MNCGAGKNLLVKGYKAMKIAKNRDIFENPKKMIFEKKKKDQDKLLDEEQIKDLDN